MKHAIVIGLLALGGLGACGKSAEDQAKEDVDKEEARHPKETPTPRQVKEVPAPTGAAAKAPEPEPTTPAEIDHARNQAMIDGRDKDVLRFCEMGKLDDKSNPQALLGCTLAACRINDADKAKVYGTPLPKLLKDQAIRVCVANHIAL
jgi:hypothetical protein